MTHHFNPRLHPDPRWFDHVEPISAAVRDQRITPMQGLDLLTEAFCAELIDNTLADYRAINPSSDGDFSDRDQ